jgi:D-lactate dehydrogenase
LDVFFYEAFDEEREALKRCLVSGIRAGFSPDTVQESRDTSPPALFISTRTQSRIPSGWSAQISGILTRSTGFDHIKAFLHTCSKPIPAGYLPLYCSRAVAEQALVLWLSLMRRLPQQILNFSRFNRDGLTGRECTGKVLLVVGVGNIGHEICHIGKALGMTVLGVDIAIKHSDIHYVSIEEGLSQADIIVCSMNLTEKNVGYFHYTLLKKARPGVVFINIARGELSPAKDLLRLLDEKHIRGIGLDVYENESELAEHLRTGRAIETDEIQPTLELGKRKNVILTPHNAFNTAEALEAKARQSVQQIEHFLKQGSFIWPVP